MDLGIKIDPPAAFSDAGRRTNSNKDASMEKTAEQFESFLIFSMLKEFEKATHSTKKSYAEQTQMSLFYEKVGDVLAKKGIGIRDMIAKYTERSVKVSDDKGENR
jgi:Rod binding domain-containing protein